MITAEIEQIISWSVSQASSATWDSLVSTGSAAGVALMGQGKGNMYSLDISDGFGRLHSAMLQVSLPTVGLMWTDFNLQLKLPALQRAIDKIVAEYPSVRRQGN